MSHALDEFVSKSKNIKNDVILYDFIDFHLPTLHAIAIEFARLPSMFGLMNKFKRAAVLTDKPWLTYNLKDGSIRGDSDRHGRPATTRTRDQGIHSKPKGRSRSLAVAWLRKRLKYPVPVDRAGRLPGAASPV